MIVFIKTSAKVANINGIAKQIAIKMQLLGVFLPITAFLYTNIASVVSVFE
jgi:hypothetical protein